MNPYSPPGALPDTFAAAPPPYAMADGATVSEATVELLRQTRPWVMLLGILAFVGCALMVVVGLLAAGFAMMAPGAKETPAALGLVYLPLAALYVYPGIKLWSYGAAISRLMASRSSADLEDALSQQKSFWKFSGIASVVVLVLYAVGFALLIAFGALAAMKMGKLGQ
jgi:hypothetical protein